MAALYHERYIVVSNEEIDPGIHLLWVNSSSIALQAKPGQFVMATCDESPTRLLRRPLSVFRIKDDKVAFLFAAAGTGTRWLAERQPGQKVDLLGPMGNGFKIDKQSKKLLLIGGGIGIAPLYFLAQRALEQGLDVRLLAGFKTRIHQIQENGLVNRLQIQLATEDGSAGTKGKVNILIARNVSWADQLYLCGPLPMYKTLSKNERDFQGKPVQVSLEVRMGCGLGFCYACTIKTRQGIKQVCKDGPVFAWNDIAWENL
jgi:dihydroorotate dehydrogenase electron transfer subunit